MGALQQTLASVGGGAVLPPFSPNDIAGLSLWLAADAIVGLSDNDPISTWPDASANGYHATASSGDRPTYQTNELNTKPVARFNGSNQMDSLYPSNQKPFTVLAVVNATDFADYRCIIGSAGATGLEWRLNATSGVQNMDKQASAGIGSSTTAVAAATWTIISATYSNVGAWAYYFGITADNSGTNHVAFSSTTMVLGSASGVHRFLGDIAEVICYDSVLSGADLLAVQGYLKTKYGL